MFDETTVRIFYGLQLLSLAIWFVGSCKVLLVHRRFQHAEWHHTAARLFWAYCLLEFLRIADCGYTDWDTGITYLVWGVVPWCVRLYAWVLRDVVMFCGICVYLEHAVTWSSIYLDEPVPTKLILGQKIACGFGNVVFLMGSTMYMIKNDQFWQPVCPLAQIPPNIMMTVVCYHLWNTLRRIPCQLEERWYTLVASASLLAGGCVCLCVFPPWAVPRLIELWANRLPAHGSFALGTSIMWESALAFGGRGNRLDLFVEMVEMSVGWCGLMAVWLPLQSNVLAAPGEPLVLSAEEIGKRHRFNSKKSN